MDHEAEIRAVLDGRRASVEDKDAVANVQALGPEAVLFDLPPPLAVTGDPVTDIERAKEWFATWKGPIATEMREVVIKCDGNVGFAPHAPVWDSHRRQPRRLLVPVDDLPGAHR